MLVLLGRLLAELMRDWDRRTAEKRDALSRHQPDRAAAAFIHKECYGRDSTVVYPPVDTDFYCPRRCRARIITLAVSAFMRRTSGLTSPLPTCNWLQLPLVVIGTGQDERRLKSLAGPTIRFLGWQSDESDSRPFARCRTALVSRRRGFRHRAGRGTGVWAHQSLLSAGKATETVISHGGQREPTGIFFGEQSVEALMECR